MSLKENWSTYLKYRAYRTALICFSALAISGSVASVQAAFILNGGFESSTNGPGQLGFNTDVTNWTVANGSYNFLFASGTGDTTGSNGSYGKLALWGPNNGGIGTGPQLPASSPLGGNYLAADGAFQVGAISQTLTGLTVGNGYNVGFWWAGAQQSGFTGDTTEQWVVSFGNSTQSTVVLNDSSHGFTGWQYQTFQFTADASTDVLSFLAVGMPNGEPPFSLLDGVSVSAAATPEPGYFVLTFGILALMAGVRVFKLKKNATS